MQGGLAEGGDSRDPYNHSLRLLKGSGWARIPPPPVLLEESFLKQDQAGNGGGGGEGGKGVRVRARCR